MSDELDARKKRVLRAVIDDYIESAEPVGSRTLARKYDLGVSPATIRNEMADLEMLGSSCILLPGGSLRRRVIGFMSTA